MVNKIEKKSDNKCPDCGSDIKEKWSGVECTKCTYWFCF